MFFFHEVYHFRAAPLRGCFSQSTASQHSTASQPAQLGHIALLVFIIENNRCSPRRRALLIGDECATDMATGLEKILAWQT